MRPRLLLILLFSVLCGYNLSASHMAAGSHTFHAGIEQLSSPVIAHDLNLFKAIYLDTNAEYFTAGDIEDEEETDSQSSRRSRLLTNSFTASAQVIILSRHNHSLPVIPINGIASCKYITQRTLRI